MGEDVPGGLERELAAVAGRVARVLSPPEITAVHVPAAEAEASGHAEFCAVQLADGSTGLAYALLGDAPERLRALAARVPAGASPSSA